MTTITIPDEVVRILEGPTFPHGGTRDAELVPHHHIGCGVRVTPDRTEVEVLLANLPNSRFATDIADNGRLTLTCSHPASHTTYQLKGAVSEIREPTDEEREFQRAWTEQLLGHMRQVQLPEHLVARAAGLSAAPVRYLRLRVEQIFDQTPGPRAGERIA